MMSLRVSVCLGISASGGVELGLVSLCLVLCVFMMSLFFVCAVWGLAGIVFDILTKSSLVE